MSPELQLLLETMHADIRGIDERTRAIETEIAGSHRVREGVRWVIGIAVAAFAGLLGSHVSSIQGSH